MKAISIKDFLDSFTLIIFWTPQLTATFIVLMCNVQHKSFKHIWESHLRNKSRTASIQVLWKSQFIQFYSAYEVYKKRTFMRRTIQQSFIQTSSKNSVPFKSRSFWTARMYYIQRRWSVLGSIRSCLNTENKKIQKSESLFYVQCFNYKHNFNFTKNHKEKRTFC